MKRGKGRPKLNSSETLTRTYNISEKQYSKLKAWCKKRGFKVSEVLRLASLELMKEGSLNKLLQNEKWREEALSLIN